MGCSDQCRYSVVAGGDVTARFTWRVMHFFLFVRLWHWLYHCCDVPFRWNISSVVVASLVWLFLILRSPTVSLLTCRRVVCVPFLSLSLRFGLFTHCCLLEFQEHRAIFHRVSGYSFSINESGVYVARSV
jgi:hypothetical protein